MYECKYMYNMLLLINNSSIYRDLKCYFKLEVTGKLIFASVPWHLRKMNVDANVILLVIADKK